MSTTWIFKALNLARAAFYRGRSNPPLSFASSSQPNALCDRSFGGVTWRPFVRSTVSPTAFAEKVSGWISQQTAALHYGRDFSQQTFDAGR